MIRGGLRNGYRRTRQRYEKCQGWFKFWSGTSAYEEVTVVSDNDVGLTSANGYNNSSLSEFDSETLRERYWNEFSIREGNYGIKQTSTKVPKN